jgi:Yip1 domain
MSEASVAPSPVAPEAGGGFFQNLIDLYFSPREAFARIVRAPRFMLPLVAYVAIVLGFTGVWMHKMDPAEFMKTQLEESGRADKMTAEQKQAVIDTQSKMMPVLGWVFGPVFIAIMLLAVSGTLTFVFRFFYGGDVTFKQAIAIVLWTFLAVSIISTPVMLTVMALKGDWNLDPNQVVQANLGLLLDKSTAAKPLWSLFTSIDVFVLWMVFLMAVGFGVAIKKPTASTLWGVVIPWFVFVGLKVGASALF